MQWVYSTTDGSMLGIQLSQEEYTVWIDPFGDFDFTQLETEPFDTHEAAYAYLQATYGDLVEYTE